MDNSTTFPHPGLYIRSNVLPKGMKVTEAASLLGIGRPALSNLLNGNAALSPDMAARLERAFGVSARDLMDLQAAYDTRNAQDKGAAAFAKSYVPPFLQLKARDIEDWSKQISARSRLAVFLRTLVNSTGLKLEKVDFPGNDNAERSGWDGFVKAEEATPWIPPGISGWEFGTNEHPKEKADKDYEKSVKQMPESRERQEITFVFVTPRPWPGKNTWEKQRRAEGKWKDVRVLDSNDLEQWLEQSIPAQAWLANECGQPSDGVLSLDACWKQWAADCHPIPAITLFDSAVEQAKPIAKAKFSKSPSEPLTISADSTLEALAFLHCLFSSNDLDLFSFRDRVIVFTAPGTLTKLVSKSTHFIAVVHNRDVEKELAPHKQNLRSVIIYPRNTTNTKPDIILEPLSYEQFSRALETMGCSHDDIKRLTRESGCSLTILRRRLSKLDAIQTPSWAANRQIAKSLIPFLFAGAWKVNNEADKTILELLANNTPYSNLESNIATLLQLEDAPIWSVGEFRGLVSKIDVLFAINKDIIIDDLERFLDVAEKFVLSEDDPSLDLPEDKRWAAALYGKTREISSALREGICETMVLLAVHGNLLLKERLGIDLELRIGRLITALLTPLTTRALEAYSSNLPMYAEAAPTAFIELLEKDLESETPQSLALMRPASTDIFGRCPRTGLLWALESLAWSPEYLARTSLILARLAEPVINDNWANKPRQSLSAIFRSWMPQTAASLEQRKAVLGLICERFPQIAWDICVEQFDGDSRIGHYSHKPRWKNDGHGYGDPVTQQEAYNFARYALDKAIWWKTHDRETISDLITNINSLFEPDQEAIWSLVEEWSKNASESDKSWIREKIRVSTFTRRALKKGANYRTEGTLKRAKAVYESLLPSDAVLKHEWLFRKSWVAESADELQDEDLDFRRRDERVSALREEAIKEIVETKGLEGIVNIAELGEASHIIGWLLPRILTTTEELINAIRFILDRGPLSESASRRLIISGMLNSLPQNEVEAILSNLNQYLKPDELAPILILCPFNNTTWHILDSMDKTIKNEYWRNVHFNWPHTSDEELQFAVDRLIEVNRPRAAFQLAHLFLEKLQPKQLFRLMVAIISKSEEPAGTYRLEAYLIRKAFDIMEKSGEIAVEEMAGLEFNYIDIFDYNNYRIPNLEKQIEKNPELYVQAVAFTYKRDDDQEDPKELQARDMEHLQARAASTYKLLERLAYIPGHNLVGELDSKEIEKWVETVRIGCRSLARERVCDNSLGKLFSTAPIDEDGVWPCKPVRDALEKIITESMSNGLTTGLYNGRGAHWRGASGQQERNLAEKYRNWTQTIQFTHPRLAKVLMGMVNTYEREASWLDTEAVVRKRLQQ